MNSRYSYLYYLVPAFLFSGFLLVWLSSCNNGLDESLLWGRWQATELYEQSELLDLDLSPVYFEFFPNDRYYFQSTLNLQEAGRYYIIGQLLYTTDTTATIPLEKAVKIIQLTPDSLSFQMNDDGIEKFLQLVRKVD